MRGDASGIFSCSAICHCHWWCALGSVARFWLSGAIAQKFGETFPAGTLLVKSSGSLIIGFFAGLTGPDGRILVESDLRQFFMIGIAAEATPRFRLSACKRSTWPATANCYLPTLNTIASVVLLSASPSGSVIISRCYLINGSISRHGSPS